MPRLECSTAGVVALCASAQTAPGCAVKLFSSSAPENFPVRAGVAPDSPAANGRLGILGSHVRAWLQKLGASFDDEPAAAVTAPEAHFYGSIRVLVVDDNPVNLMVASAMLESRGLVPWLAEDGAEAVALAGELQFDIILMDLQMPILDGLGATSAIRQFEKDNALPAVPVIAYSSTLAPAELLAAHGLDGCLGKPFDDRELEDCMVRWCPAYRPDRAAPRTAEGNSRWHAPALRSDTRRTPSR
jgi:CheY-like chemotaxis protein